MNAGVRILGESEYDAWDRFAGSAANGGVYSTTTYLDALCSGTCGTFRIAAMDADGRFQAGVALYEAHCRWGRYLSPRSLLPYNGFVLPDGDSQYPSQRESQRNKRLNDLAEWLEEAGYVEMTIRTQGAFLDARVFLQRNWQPLATYTYVVPLDDPDVHWELVDRDLKRQIRKCESRGYVVVEDDDIDSLLEFHYSARERKGFKAYLPRPEFRTFVETLGARGLARLFHVRSASGKAVASQLVVADGHPTCHIVAAGSDPEYNKHGVNALLRWRSFQMLAGHGYRSVDLSDASLNAVSRFKSRFGGNLVTSLAVRRTGGPILSRLGNRLEGSLRRLASGT